MAKSFFRCFTVSALLGLLLVCSGAIHCASVRSSAIHCASSSQEAWTFAVYGDCRSNHRVHSKIVELMTAARPEFVLNTGDLVERGRRMNEWENFFRIIAPLLDAKIPYYPARGNHDEGGEAQWETRFDIPSGSGSKLYYSFDCHNAHFIALDTESPLKADNPQYQWFEKDLAATQAQHVFVFFHRPPYSIGMHGPSKGIRQAVSPLLEKHKDKIRAVFNGHDHLYYRAVRNGILYVVTGGGGAPLYQTWFIDEAQKGDAHGVYHHYLLMTVNGAEVTGKVYDLDGKERDQLKVRR